MEHDLNIYQMIFDTVTIITFVFGVVATTIVAVQLFQVFAYSKLDKLRDQAEGLIRTFPIAKPFIIMVICWAWVITVWLSP